MENKESNLQVVPRENRDDNCDEDEAIPPRIQVAKFDYSFENHIKAMDKILELSGESESDYDQSEIQRMSSSVSFVREWRHICYKPQAIRFVYESETPQRKDVTGVVNLTQFSSASVPKDISDGNKVSSHLSKDFVLYVGGLVWALDWCPRVHQRPGCDVNLEFIAIAAHPSESSYNKIGAPLTGGGVIQIWCLLNHVVKDHDVISQVSKKTNKKSTSNEATNLKTTQSKRPRGRPRKNSINESINLDDNNQYVKPLSTNFPDDSLKLLKVNEIVSKSCSDTKVVKLSKPRKPKTNRKKPTDEDVDNSKIHSEDEVPNKTQGYPEKSKSRLAKCKLRLKSRETATDPFLQSQKYGGRDPMRSSAGKTNPVPLETDPDRCKISEDIALPRLVMCLAHNGKVAWDVKWRPFDSCVNSKHRMGYLAVLLGNGALEVWEVPLPGAAAAMFSACQEKGVDPRFIKLEPVFRCSMLKCGDRQSIPLTMEWSTSSPHDLILAGCHDGVVALWKFSANSPLKDTRPLLCFSADTVPIRALAWAPAVSDFESANIIVTAGHKGVKFWDIRDPYRPLWDVNPVQRIIYSLDWLPDPRCVVLSFDDGEIRIISLSKAACDVPVTGTPFVGTQLQGLHSYHCSSSSIWSVQVSRLTGMVAYCCSDGTVLHFQLTSKAVEKDPRRSREPHYLCGGLSMEGSSLTVFSPLPNIPFPMKKSSNVWSDTPGSRRGFLAISNQEKRAREELLKCQTPQDQHLALCYNNDPGSDSEHISKTKHTDDTESVNESFPPKIVAMHRVRWNMNKGSERWLCYGGAAGIVRCQEITSPKK